MYDLGLPCVDDTVPAGTNLLVAGPAMTGKRNLTLDVVAHGARDGEGTIVVTTKDDAETLLTEIRGRVPDADPPVGVVDCVTRQQGVDDEVEGDLVRYASSPVDLTGIGIEFSELLRQFYEERAVERNRALLYSLSTLLMYSNLQTVFRFVHVFTGRVQTADALGLFTIDEPAHEEQTVSTLKQLFDGVVEVRETDGGRECRLTGVAGVDASWTRV